MSKSYYVLNRSGIILTPGDNGCGVKGKCDYTQFTLGNKKINILDKIYWKRSTDNRNLIFNKDGKDQIFNNGDTINISDNGKITFKNTTRKTFEINCSINMYIHDLDVADSATRALYAAKGDFPYPNLKLFLENEKNSSASELIVNTITPIRSGKTSLQMSFTCIKEFSSGDILTINTQSDTVPYPYYGIDDWTTPTMTINLDIKEL